MSRRSGPRKRSACGAGGVAWLHSIKGAAPTDNARRLGSVAGHAAAPPPVRRDRGNLVAADEAASIILLSRPCASHLARRAARSTGCRRSQTALIRRTLATLSSG